MAIECCDRCGHLVDLGRLSTLHAIEYIDSKPVCTDCITEKEWAKIDPDTVQEKGE
ncbi:hypothetical protein LCGC14_1130890 [marine sediment metagenome]|uniref:LIM zinc-binding domain-containing protein n=1 Tax=marine sediment metagenome TaxID=412755 RepID=A0A0F9Q6W9_9ZZZZ